MAEQQLGKPGRLGIPLVVDRGACSRWRDARVLEGGGDACSWARGTLGRCRDRAEVPFNRAGPTATGGTGQGKQGKAGHHSRWREGGNDGDGNATVTTMTATSVPRSYREARCSLFSARGQTSKKRVHWASTEKKSSNLVLLKATGGEAHGDAGWTS